MLLINAILIGIYYSISQENEEPVVRKKKFLGMKQLDFITDYLKNDHDKKHIIDLVQFQKVHSDVCITEKVKSPDLKVKIYEYQYENMKLIRLKSGFMAE
mmetsp:Transcript_13998/g.13604  ORF Transcript_13998/g.13604 Transcript_13998/m.13604 type:complete len:100 (+) Transcript_13998:38-337(+)